MILNNKIKIFCLVLFCLVLAIFFAYFFIQRQIRMPYNAQNAEKNFIINEGESSKIIAKRLEKENFIGDDFYFLFYLWQKKSFGSLQAGEYALNLNMAIPEITEIFTNGRVKQDWVWVTIPEGFNLKKIDARLAENNLIKKGELINFNLSLTARDKGFIIFDFDMEVKNLEGFLFPDTYRFKRDASLDEIINKMLENFEQKIDLSVREKIKGQNRNIYDVLIMASILEKEVKSDEDRKIVAGIFWDRIKRGQPLESCATIAYILGIDKWRYSYEDTRVQSPYNTYLNKGLPPTPINNPGLSTISAAIYPVDTDYNYFLTDPETENTIFSKTFEEHNKNKRKYLGA